MSLPLYLTTEVKTAHPYIVNSAANTLLTPVRYLWAGRIIQVVDGTIQPPQDYTPNKTWYKTAFMIAALIPGLIVGAVARSLCIFIQEVDDAIESLAHRLREKALPPQPQPPELPPAPPENPAHMPLRGIVDKTIDYYNRLLAATDEEIPELLKENASGDVEIDYFTTASFIKESTAPLEDLSSEKLGEILTLFNQVCTRLDKLNLLHSVQESFIKPPEAKPPASQPPTPAASQIAPAAQSVAGSQSRSKKAVGQTLTVLSLLKRSIPDPQFKRYCEENGLKYAEVKAQLAKFETEKREAERKALYTRQANKANEFLLFLSDQKDEHVGAWLDEKAKLRDYPFPFFHGRQCDIDKRAYKEYLTHEFIRVEFKDRYDAAAARLKRLGLSAWLNENPR